MNSNALKLTILLAGFPAKSFANAVGSDFQTFNPTTSGLDFVTVQSSETLEPGVWNFGLFLNHAINALPEFEDGKVDRPDRGSVRNSLTVFDFGIGFGVMKDLDLGISIPAVIAQTTNDQTAEKIEFGSNGVNQVRLNTKYRLFGDDAHGAALVCHISQNLIKKNPTDGKDSQPTTILEFAADTTVNKIALGANLGYKWRSRGEQVEDMPIEPFGNQFLYSVAASYYMSPIDTKIIGEVYGSQAANNDEPEMQRLQNTLEGLIGLKHQPHRQVDLNAGMATYLEKNVVSPDFRFYLGINIALQPQEKVVVVKPKPMPKSKPKRKKKPAEPLVPAPVKEFMIQGVYFGFDSDREVVRGATEALKDIVEYFGLKEGENRILLTGHTDSVGDDGYNIKLGLKRAKIIKRYLVVVFGVDPKNVDVRSLGESQPIADNGNFQGRQKNRRVEASIIPN